MSSSRRIIGVVDHVWDSSHVYYARLAAGLCAKLRGYDLIASNELSLLPLQQVAGILYRYRTQREELFVRKLATKNLPIVALNSPIEGIPTINADFQSGTTEAILHLKNIGRRKIAYIRGKPGVPTVIERYEAFLAAMDLADAPLDPALEVEADFGYQRARTQVFDLLGREPDIDAIVCCSDRAAMGAIHAAKQRGFRVPENIAIVGLGNMPEILAYSDLPLSTVADPLFTEAFRGTEKLIDIIEGADPQPPIELVSTHLVKRYSTIGREYIDPHFSGNFGAGQQALRYLLCIGGALEEAERDRLAQMLYDALSVGAHPFDAFIDFASEAISLGFDASLAHDIAIQLGHRLRIWENPSERPPCSTEDFESAVHEITCAEIPRYGRLSRATQEELEQILEPLANFHEDTISMDSFLKTLASLRHALECKLIGIMVLDESVEDLQRVACTPGRYWTVTESGISPFCHAQLKDLDPTGGFNVPNLSLDLIPLYLDGEIAAVAFIDMETRCSPFYRKIKPLLESKLHRTRLFASLETSRQEIEKQKTLAENANRAKSEFLAIISHEIRTPLNCMMGMTELALNTELTQEQRNFLELAHQSSKEQMDLINELLNLSKIESGDVEARQDPFSLAEVFDRLRKMLGKRAEDKGLSLSITQADDIPKRLVGDPLSIHQILTNLVGNAIKFTENGTIAVSATRIQSEPETVTLRFEVRDEGIGIPSDKLQSIFNAFEQVDSSNARSNDGVGLGLAIVKKTADAIAAKLSVESVVNHGSCFSVEVTLHVDSNAEWFSDQTVKRPKRSRPTAKPIRRRLLVVEDNEPNSIVTEAMLRQANYQVDIARSGYEAIKRWRSASYDVILLDIAMPGMNGHEVARRIRSVERERGDGARTPIIALTAQAEEGVVSASRASGMDDIVTKPVTRSNLLESIESVTYTNQLSSEA